MAAEIISRTISVMLNRLNGMPRFMGSWQARAFIWAISTGGKIKWPSLSWSIFKPLFSFLEKALAPLAHRFSGKIELFTNYLILKTFCSQKNYLRPDHIPIRCRIFSGHRDQISLLDIRKNNLTRTCSWHNILPCYKEYYTIFS